MESIIAGLISGVVVGLWFRHERRAQGVQTSGTPFRTYIIFSLLMGFFGVLAFVLGDTVIGVLGIFGAVGSVLYGLRTSRTET